MKRIINTLRYSDIKTKLVLIFTLISGFGTAALFIFAIIKGILLLFFAGIACGFVTITLAQTLGMCDIADEKTAGEPKEANEPEAEVRSKSIKAHEAVDKTVKKAKKETRIYDASGKTDVRENYTKQTMKKTLHRFKVKRDHRKVIIDRCEKLGIKQTPAYVWVANKIFNILIIDREPRIYTLPLYSIKEITYLKKQPASEEDDYELFKGKSFIANLFRPCLPDYFYNTKVDDLTSYKNLYGIGPGIYFTNNSAASLFDLLGIRFYVDDKITRSAKVNYFFKEIYKCNILLRDNVINANTYADMVSGFLNDMAHSTISHNEFRDTLNTLIKNKLITQEYAIHFSMVRDKISR